MKKLTAILLSTAITASMAVTSVSAAVDENGRYTPDESVDETHRYYFAMPDDWYNEYTDTAGVFWWSGSDVCVSLEGDLDWPGYKAQIGNYKGVYYVDCPTDVSQIIWNNYLDFGTDTASELYSEAKQSKDAATEFFSEGDSELYPKEFFEEMEESYNGDKALLGDFADNFFYDELYNFGFCFNMDNMIYVTDSYGEYSLIPNTYSGDWYFYYGNGEYGTYPTKKMAQERGTYNKLEETPSTPQVTECDMNDDGRTNIIDVTLIQKCSIAPDSFTETQIALADVNNNGVVNVMDATSLQKAIAYRI